jgi:lia operon protein LiaH
VRTVAGQASDRFFLFTSCRQLSSDVYNLGMASLFQKLKTLVRATLHDLADQAIQKSDLAVYDDYIRQADRELERFKRTIAPMIAQVRTTKRRRELLADKAARLDYMIDEFLRQGKQTEAMVSQKQLMSTMELIEIYDGSLERQVEAAERLDDVRIKLEGRLAIAKQERAELAFLLQLAKAKEVSTKAMRSLDSLMGYGDSEVSRAAENIRKRLDHADAAWEVEASGLDNQLDEAMHSLEVETELAARMERLGI